jgi:hypothetical protein
MEPNHSVKIDVSGWMMKAMEAEMAEDAATELQALARQKGYRLKKTEQAGKYWLIDESNGLPEINPDDYTPSFNHIAAMQFLLEAVDVQHTEPQAA